LHHFEYDLYLHSLTGKGRDTKESHGLG